MTANFDGREFPPIDEKPKGNGVFCVLWMNGKVFLPEDP